MPDGVDAVLAVLESAGFERLPKPLVVAGSTFDFDAAVMGTGVSHDLVVIASSTTESRRLVRLLSGLGRTLDQADSAHPVSLVLLGEPPDGHALADLERHARVLLVPIDPADKQIRQAVAVLLPLTLPSAAAQGGDPLTEVITMLGSTHSAEHQELIDTAPIGPGAVRESLRRYIDAAIQVDDLERDES